MPKSDLISAIVLVVFGLLMLGAVIPSQTSDGGDASISPALLPQICATAITGLAAILAVRAWRKLTRGEAAGQSVAASEWLACAVGVAAVSLAVILFLWVTPALAAAVLIAGLMVFMGERRWWLIIALPAVLITGTWALFTQVLGTAIG